MMQYTFDITLKNRKILLNFLGELSLDQLNKIPEGFRNNIYWNIKHIVVTQQLLVYGLSEMPLLITAAEVDGFKKGTVPLKDATDKDVDILKKQLLLTLEKTIEDFTAGNFNTYNEYTTNSKSILTNVEEAINFNNFHEGVHLGYILALKRFI